MVTESLATESKMTESQLIIKITKYQKIIKSEALFRCSTLGQAPGLAYKHLTRLVKLARDKRSNSLHKFVTYGLKTFYNIGLRFYP